MRVHKKLENENKYSLQKILIPLFIMALVGYFLYILIAGGFFKGWEVYFAAGCYTLILIVLICIDAEIMRWIYYDIYIKDGKLKIKDGFFTRAIAIPLERIYYVNSIKLDKYISYDSIIVTDKKVSHRKIRPVESEGLNDSDGHLKVINELRERYHDKKFYFYRVHHNRYKFLYYFYMIYKSCEKCRFSDVSMELVKKYAEGK